MMMSSLSWSNFIWNTNKDTYDKVVFVDLKNNVVLIAIMTYFPNEDSKKTSREKIISPIDSRTDKLMGSPVAKDGNRCCRLD